MRNSALHLVVCCLFVLALGGCSRPRRATVFCAASLTGVVESVSSDTSIRVHSDGSEKLVSQYLGGARADLLLLADANLVESLPTGSRVSVIASNRLVLATRPGEAISLESLSDPQTKLALADPKTAPLGRYSQQALSKLTISARRVTLRDATSVLTALRLGHAELGVVYASDLKRFPGLVAIKVFDSGDHEPIRYAAVLPEPAHPDALALYEIMTSKSGRHALEKAGFLPLNERLAVCPGVNTRWQK